MKKLYSVFIILGFAFSMNSTIVFYDGTTLKGELSSSDTRHVFIIPEGLVMPEKIPVVDIDNFFLENGIILVEDGLAKQTYIDGKFSVIQRNISDNNTLEANSDDEYVNLGNLDYFSISTFYGAPVYFGKNLLEKNGDSPASIPNIGVNLSLPYFPVGSVNMSASFRLLQMGFDKNYSSKNNNSKIKSITIATLLKTDLQPMLSFLGDNLHPILETGVTYSLGWPNETFSTGLGAVYGGTLDYWFENSPIGFRFISNGYIIPTPEKSLTHFVTVGASLMLALKRVH